MPTPWAGRSSSARRGRSSADPFVTGSGSRSRPGSTTTWPRFPTVSSGAPATPASIACSSPSRTASEAVSAHAPAGAARVGTGALALSWAGDYDIAVLDRDIPGSSGDEIAERIVARGTDADPHAHRRGRSRRQGRRVRARRRRRPHEAVRAPRARAAALGTQPQRPHHRPLVREIAGLRLDPFCREVYRDGRYVALTRK